MSKVIEVLFKEYYTDMWEFSRADKGFNYKVDDNLDIRKGDYVIVSTRYGLTMGLVNSVSDYTSDTVASSSGFIMKIPNYNLVDELNKKRRINEIRLELDAYEKQMHEVKKYELMTSIFPETKSLVDELKELTK